MHLLKVHNPINHPNQSQNTHPPPPPLLNPHLKPTHNFNPSFPPIPVVTQRVWKAFCSADQGSGREDGWFGFRIHLTKKKPPLATRNEERT